MARPPSLTKRKLIDAAHILIWANSYAHVSVDDICRAAGVQKGSFYHFFPTKSDLAAAALADKWQASCVGLEALFAANPTATAQLRAVCKEIYTKQKEAFDITGMVCGCPYATLASEMSGDNATLRQLSEGMSASFRGYFEKILKNAAKEGLRPKTNIAATAGEMHIYTIGAMLHARLTNSLTAVGSSLENALLRLSGMDARARTKRRARSSAAR